MAFRNIHFSVVGKPVIKIAEIKNGISGQTKFTDAEYDPIYKVAEGDMLFSWSGQPETSIDVFWWRGRDGWLNQHIFKVFPHNTCDTSFFFWLLRYLRPHFIAIARNKQTTGLGHVTKKDLQRITVGIPLHAEQKGIAHVLGTLDDKIELNRRMNETLERIARATFRSWFVDFDHVRAKAEGRTPPGLDPATAALFPDSFEESKLGPIPKGWRVETVGDTCGFVYGKALKADHRRPGPVPVFGSNGQVGWHDEPLVRGPGIVIGRKGNPGTVTWASSDFFPIDTTFYVVPRHDDLSMHYLFHALADLDLASLSADSAVPGLNRNMAYMSEARVPSAAVMAAFDRHAQTFQDRIIANNQESRTLAAIRDALLPKLLSGEIRVNVNGG